MCHGFLHGLGDQGSIKLSAPNFVPEQTLFENTTGLEEHVAWGCRQLLARRSSSPTSSREGSDPTALPRPAPPTGSTKPLPRRAGLPGRRRGEQSWYLRKRPRCQSPGTPTASHRRRQLLHPGLPNCALPVARAAPRRAPPLRPLGCRATATVKCSPAPGAGPNRSLIGCGSGWLLPSGQALSRSALEGVDPSWARLPAGTRSFCFANPEIDSSKERRERKRLLQGEGRGSAGRVP